MYCATGGKPSLGEIQWQPAVYMAVSSVSADFRKRNKSGFSAEYDGEVIIFLKQKSSSIFSTSFSNQIMKSQF